jgi:hypothetical protein
MHFDCLITCCVSDSRLGHSSGLLDRMGTTDSWGLLFCSHLRKIDLSSLDELLILTLSLISRNS